MANVPFYRHSLERAHAESIGDVLETPFLTSGEIARRVEQQLCEFFAIEHALLTNSLTNGAVATLLALDIGPGDEVIVPAMTFIATANVVELVGARPVFVDVDPATLLLRPDATAAKVTDRTKAVMPVHLYGRMCDVSALEAALAGRPDIAIIEDAAHCFEGTLQGEPPGRYGDVALFSFYATKNVTCGEGGAIVTRHPDLHARLCQTRLHGMSAGAVDRMRRNVYRHWDMLRLGTKANLPDLLAALLPEQIATIRERLPRREALAQRYLDAFAGTPIRVPAVVPGTVDARHLFTIHVPPPWRDEAMAALNRRGIGATVNYRAVPTMSYYREKYGYSGADFPHSYRWGEGTITLPLYPLLSEAMQDQVIAAVLEEVVPLFDAPAPQMARRVGA